VRDGDGPGRVLLRVSQLRRHDRLRVSDATSVVESELVPGAHGRVAFPRVLVVTGTAGHGI